MIVIAERINATRKTIAKALESRDKAFIQSEAKNQAGAGAEYLDVNTAFSPDEEADLMLWAVDAIREVSDLPLSIDTANPDVAQAALERLETGSTILNSATGETGRLDPMVELTAEFDAGLIVLPMDDSGMPDSVDARWSALDAIFAATDKAGIDRERLYVDPLVRPVATNPEQALQCLEMIESVVDRGDGAQTVCGLSNISYGLPNRAVMNRTFLAMAVGAGLAAAILDPLDEDLVATRLAAEALAGEDEFCMAYITAARESRLG